MKPVRCSWVSDDPLLIAYHDQEWGVPAHEDKVLFEFLVLEGAQAGLSWMTILRKREGYRRAYSGFDPVKVARYDARKVASLLKDESIVRNRLKIESSIENARALLRVNEELGSFDRFIWSFVGGDERRASRARLPIRGVHHLLFLHAGLRAGMGPHPRLLSQRSHQGFQSRRPNRTSPKLRSAGSPPRSCVRPSPRRPPLCSLVARRKRLFAKI